MMMMTTRWFSCTVPSVLLSKLTKHQPSARAAKSQSVSYMELDQILILSGFLDMVDGLFFESIVQCFSRSLIVPSHFIEIQHVCQ